jgi:hypothetical protein
MLVKDYLRYNSILQRQTEVFHAIPDRIEVAHG